MIFGAKFSFKYFRNKKRIYCHLPYSSVFVTLDGKVRPCCFGEACGDLNTHSISEIWNSQAMVEKRKGLLDGDLVAAGCQECGWLNRRDVATYDRDESLGQSSVIRENITRQRIEYESGKLVLKSYPSVFTIQVTEACNFRCIMCFQEHAPKELDTSIFDKIMISSHLIDEFKFTGGEPFVSGWVRQFIDDFDPENGQKIGFTTNGSLLKKYKTKLERLPRLFLAISLHAATKETFEQIKVGGRWETVLENITWYAKERMKRRPYWNDGRLTFVVMSLNYEEIPQFLGLLKSLDLPALFQPVWGVKADPFNPFINKDLRCSMTSTEDMLVRAKKIVAEMRKSDRDEIINSLKYTLNQLKE